MSATDVHLVSKQNTFTHTNVNRSERHKALDALRGIAAIVVVFFHCLMMTPRWADMEHGGHTRSFLASVWIYSPLHLILAGQVAVMVFFTLSGFVLALMFSTNRPPTYAAFAVKRICRIYLPYVAVVAIAMFLMTVIAPRNIPGMSGWFNSFWRGGVDRRLIVGHLLMLREARYSYVDPPIWSLIHEMRYSLVFPAIMWLVADTSWRAAITWSLAVSYISRRYSLDNQNQVLDSLQYLFLFVAGAVLAKHRSEVSAWFENLPRTLRVAIMLASALLMATDNLMYVPGVWAQSFYFLTMNIGAVLLLLIVIGSWRIRKVLENRPLVWVGRVSYSLYLSHMILLLTLVHTLHRLLPTYAIVATVPVLALPLAGLFHEVIERPAMVLGYSLQSGLDGREKRSRS